MVLGLTPSLTEIRMRNLTGFKGFWYVRLTASLPSMISLLTKCEEFQKSVNAFSMEHVLCRSRNNVM